MEISKEIFLKFIIIHGGKWYDLIVDTPKSFFKPFAETLKKCVIIDSNKKNLKFLREWKSMR